MKYKLAIIICSLTTVFLAIITFLPYRHITLNQKEVILSVGNDIINDEIRPDNPITIKLKNCYEVQMTILSPNPIEIPYDDKTITSVPTEDSLSPLSQILELRLPFVRAEMNFEELSKNTEISFTTNDSFFEVTFYKPIKSLYSDIPIFIVLTMCINGIVLITNNILQKK